MLSDVFSWWVDRLAELMPATLRGIGAGASRRVVFTVSGTGEISALVRRDGREEAVTLGAASRLAGRKAVVLRPPPAAVLEKTHVIPSASRADMDQMLRHELQRITPFTAEAVYWQWQARPRANERTRSDVRLTLVPKVTLEAAMAALDHAGIRPNLLEIGDSPRRIMPLDDNSAARSQRHLRFKLLAWSCGVLAATAVILPFLLQEWDIYRTQQAIDALQPTISRIDALRRSIDSSSAGHDVIRREKLRNGDLPSVLAAVTRVLPDDTYLTDFSLRQRQLTIGGRSASAPNLITGLTADPAFKNVSFGAPVTRVVGSALDVFSIHAEIAP